MVSDTVVSDAFGQRAIKNGMVKRPGIDIYRKTAKGWIRLGALLQLSNVGLGVLAATLASAAAAQPFGPAFAPFSAWMAFAAGLIYTVLTSLDAQDRGRRLSAAGRHLEDSILLFDTDPAVTFREVMQSRERGIQIARGQLLAT